MKEPDELNVLWVDDRNAPRSHAYRDVDAPRTLCGLDLQGPQTGSDHIIPKCRTCLRLSRRPTGRNKT